MTYTTRVLPPEEWGRLAGTELELFVPHMTPERSTVVVVEDESGRVVGCWALFTVLHAEGVWVDPAHRGRAGVARHLLRATLDAARERGVRGVASAALTPEVERLLTKHLGAVPLPGKQFVFETGG